MRHIFIVLALLCTSCKGKEGTGEVQLAKTPVYAKPAKVGTVPLLIEARGTMLAASRYEVRPQVEGILEDVHVKEGQWIEKGMLLFTIDAKSYEFAFEQAKAALNQAKAHFDAVKRKKSRYSILNDKELLSKNEWEAIVQEYRQAKAEVLLAAAKRGEAELRVDHARVVAKQSGRVGKIDYFPGHYVSSMMEKPLCEVVTLDPLVAEFFVTEKEFSKIQDVKEVSIHPLTAKNESYKGLLTFIDNHFDPARGQITMRASCKNEALALRPGMCVHVACPVGMLDSVMLVPTKAVKYNQFGAFVMVVNRENVAEIRQVELGPEFEGDIVLLDGIAPDDIVISDGLEKVAIGTKVDVRT